jgi:hypothetical protein
MYSAPAVGQDLGTLRGVGQRSRPCVEKRARRDLNPPDLAIRYPCTPHRQSSVFWWCRFCCVSFRSLRIPTKLVRQSERRATFAPRRDFGCKMRPRESNPQSPGPKPCTPTRQSGFFGTIDEVVIRGFRCSTIELRLRFYAEATGLEPATRGLTGMYSNRQSVVVSN